MTGSASDPSSVDTAAGFSWAWSVTKNGVPYANATTQNFSFTPNDNATYVVTLKATDKDGGNASVSKTITVANVAPNSTSGFISIDPISGVVSANVAWFDPGTLDGQTVKFDYFRNGGVTPAATRIVTVGANVGTASDNLTQLEPGCCPSPWWRRSRGGSGTRNVAAGSTANVYLATFGAPIKNNERNIAKYGNTVPLKITLTSSCSPTVTTTAPNLFVTLIKGSDIAPEGVEIIPESTSSADTGNQMRPQAGGYMYNLTTKGLQQGADYEIRIRVGDTMGPIIAEALLQPKK